MGDREQGPDRQGPKQSLWLIGFLEVVADGGFVPLPIALDHAILAEFLPVPHRDPFDRMLAAQAQIEDLSLVTADPVFRAFGTRVLW